MKGGVDFRVSPDTGKGKERRGSSFFREENCNQTSRPFQFRERVGVLLSFSDGAQGRIPTNSRDIIESEPRGYSDPKERSVRILGISWTDDFNQTFQNGEMRFGSHRHKLRP